jgi:endonuclease/exonuclease/phosphatase family metal-dependent hydrolase
MYILGRVLTVGVFVIITLAALVAGYLIYLNVNYARLPDGQAQSLRFISAAVDSYAPENEADEKRLVGELPVMNAGTTYSAMTFNIGFGANDHDFSFFMSENRISGGAVTKGLDSRARSEASVTSNIASVLSTVNEFTPDIALLQEVDRDADRSYHMDQMHSVASAWSMGGKRAVMTYATNFHTPWLCYPPTHPIGRIRDSGLLTLGRYRVDSAVRRSYPVSDAFPDKFFDLDRCFSVVRVPVRGGGVEGGTAGELVLINTHMSAYDEGSDMREAQMKTLAKVLREAYEQGHWVIVGGDFNGALGVPVDAFTGRQDVPKWMQPFDERLLPEGFSVVRADNADNVATCRDSSIPWTPGVSYESVVDGFIVSDNVNARAENVDANYTGSDHNPVLLSFSLLPGN